MIQTLLKTKKFRLVFFSKIHQKSIKNHEQRYSKIDLEIDTIFYRFFKHFGALLGPLGASLATIFHTKCYDPAKVLRFWTRSFDFCMALTTPGTSGTTLGTILSPFWCHFGRILGHF